jgi:hypothetical protein
MQFSSYFCPVLLLAGFRFHQAFMKAYLLLNIQWLYINYLNLYFSLLYLLTCPVHPQSYNDEDFNDMISFFLGTAACLYQVSDSSMSKSCLPLPG